jgi:hypothetical protein
MANFGPIMAKFSGSEDPKTWLDNYINSLDTAGIPPSMWHIYFCRNLDSLAHKWYLKEVKYTDKLHWEKLCTTFEEKWTPLYSAPAMSTLPDDASEKLCHLATSSPDSPLGKLWQCAFEEGKKTSYSEGAKLFEGAEINKVTKVAAERGYEKGIEIGQA